MSDPSQDSAPRPRGLPLPGLAGWARRTSVERVAIYTLGCLHVLFWFLLAMGALGAAAEVRDTDGVLTLCVATAVLGACATVVLRQAIRLYPDRAPVPWASVGLLLALSAVAGALTLLAPERSRLSLVVVVVGALSWGAGGLRDRRVQWAVAVACPVLVVVATGVPLLGLYGLALGLFFVFTVQSSLWLLGVVTELDGARGTQAALAVAEERLRFSRDVHDVLGRRLSTIAVQAELAAALTDRGDPRATSRILEVREVAHVALREARELARGYGPLDLHHEVEGAVSLLRSAGIDATADLDGLAALPEAWHEPVARVIREAVTNVLRHSAATQVVISHDGDVVVVRDDGPTPPSRPGAPAGAGDGTGLAALRRDLAVLGADLSAGPDGSGTGFVVRVRLTGSPPPSYDEPGTPATTAGERS